jgi:hypothetical protein
MVQGHAEGVHHRGQRHAGSRACGPGRHRGRGVKRFSGAKACEQEPQVFGAAVHQLLVGHHLGNLVELDVGPDRGRHLVRQLVEAAHQHRPDLHHLGVDGRGRHGHLA